MTEDEENEQIEKLLTGTVNRLADELKKLRPGDPAHIEIAAGLKLAKKALKEHREHMKKRKK